MTKKVKKKITREERTLLRVSSDPEMVLKAHKLFVIHRLTFKQIAMAMKRQFGITSKVKNLAATISEWAHADKGFWLKERDDYIKEEIRLRHEGEELLRELVKIIRDVAPEIRSQIKKGDISATLLNSFSNSCSKIYKIFEAKRKEEIGDIIITGYEEFELFLSALEDVLGPEFKRILPDILRVFAGKAKEYNVKVGRDILQAINLSDSASAKTSALH